MWYFFLPSKSNMVFLCKKSDLKIWKEFGPKVSLWDGVSEHGDSNMASASPCLSKLKTFLDSLALKFEKFPKRDWVEINWTHCLHHTDVTLLSKILYIISFQIKSYKLRTNQIIYFHCHWENSNHQLRTREPPSLLVGPW